MPSTCYKVKTTESAIPPNSRMNHGKRAIAGMNWDEMTVEERLLAEQADRVAAFAKASLSHLDVRGGKGLGGCLCGVLGVVERLVEQRVHQADRPQAGALERGGDRHPRVAMRSPGGADQVPFGLVDARMVGWSIPEHARKH